MKKIKYIFLLLFINLIEIQSQVVYLHTSHEVYNYLKRLESTQIITGLEMQ